MEKKTKKVPKEILEDADVWVTTDGREFLKESDAMAHEGRLGRKATFTERYRKKIIEDGTEIIFLPDQITPEVRGDLELYYKNADVMNLKPGWQIVFVDDSGDYTHTSFTSIDSEIADLRHKLTELKRLKDSL